MIKSIIKKIIMIKNFMKKLRAVEVDAKKIRKQNLEQDKEYYMVVLRGDYYDIIKVIVDLQNKHSDGYRITLYNRKYVIKLKDEIVLTDLDPKKKYLFSNKENAEIYLFVCTYFLNLDKNKEL